MNELAIFRDRRSRRGPVLAPYSIVARSGRSLVVVMLGVLGVGCVACSCSHRAPASASGRSSLVGSVAAIAVASPSTSTSTSPHVDARADEREPAGARFRCGKQNALLEPGHVWTEERTSSATAVGPGGYMGQVWEGPTTSEQRLEKKILAMDGETITRMRVKFLVDRHPEYADENAPNHRTPHEGKAALLVRRAGQVDVDAETTADKESIERLSGRKAELAPEMIGPRWRGQAPALAKTFQTVMGWNELGIDEQPRRSTAVFAAAPLPEGSPFADGRAFSVTGDARNEDVAMGHSGVWKIHVTGTVVVSPEGALVESRLTTRSVLTERLNHGCGSGQKQPCPWSATVTTTKTASFRVLCDP